MTLVSTTRSKDIMKLPSAVGSALILAYGLLAGSAFAVGRATKQQMLERAKDAEGLWSAPASNYNAICATFIKSGVLSRDESLRKLSALLAASDGQIEKASLSYLVGEAHYWGGLTELTRTRDKAVLAMVGDDTVGAFLAAWDMIRSVAPGSDAAALRGTIVTRFNQILATQLCGASLSTNVKQQVIERFIERLDASEMQSTTWDVEDRGRVFANLGIGHRLKDTMPTSTPNDFDGLWRAIRLAWAIRSTNDVLALATALETQHGAELDKRPYERRQLFKIYEACGDQRALACISACATSDPTAWLEVYRYSVRMDGGLPKEMRLRYIENYLSAMKAAQQKEFAVYNPLITLLIDAGDYDTAIKYADCALEREQSHNRMSMQAAHILRLKAIAQEKGGSGESALSTIREASRLAELFGSEGVKAVFSSDLKRIEQQRLDK